MKIIKLPSLLRKSFLLIMITSLMIFTSCVSQDALSSQRESSIPWNRPASWEGAGALGGLGMGSRP